MFGLLKLLAYGLFGYAAYEFFRGMTQVPSGGGSQQQLSSSGGSSGGQRSQGQSRRQESGPTPASLTGSGGTSVSAQSADGGSMQHRVGRGVVSR